MLKNCWECVVGSRVENEVYGTALNGAQRTPWPEMHRQNENMFRLPRPLKDGDIIEINGLLRQNPEKLVLNLTTGTNSPIYINTACQVEANFSNNTFYIRGIVNGQVDKEKPSEETHILGQFPADGRFSFVITVRENADMFLDISLFESYIDSRLLSHKLGDITFLTLDGDIMKIEKLTFTFG